ncbi:hypothetical protein CLV58_12589 [Spirosoma oryzae]|uniref:Portal protein n=1 Tax=Spirosoma oryzae TaxID=1469603 RepID=A0A2T0S8R9_9BACT|nr:hypothetical protein [Spirosoma oryzae]PRY29827.1 hypothetical protein CLV58_12589 [Spirosoma oryzae]
MDTLLLQGSASPIITTSQALQNSATAQLPTMIVPDEEEGSPEYERKLDELFDKLHKAFYSRGQGHVIYDRNPMGNYNIFEGRLDQQAHNDILSPYGAGGLQRLEDFSFFSANHGILEGMLQQAGLKFSMVSKGPAWEDQRREKTAQAGAEDTLRAVASGISQQAGMDMSPALTDESIYVPQNPSEWNEKIPAQMQLEAEVYTRLDEAITHGKVESELLRCFRDKFIVNTEIMHVYPKNGQPHAERLGLDEVSFWGPKDAQSAEDMQGWAIRRNLTLTQLVAKYGAMLEEIGDLDSIMKTIGSVSNQSADMVMQQYRDGTMNEFLNGNASPIIRNGNGYDTGLSTMAIEQRIYVRLLKKINVMLLVDVELDGSACPVRELTKEEYASYKKGRYPYAERIQYMRLSSDQFQKAKAAGATSLRVILVNELWDSVRLGDKKVLYRRPLPWQEREPGRLSTPQFPIKARFGMDSSMVTKGRPIHELYTNFMILARKKLAQLGTKSIAYDMTQMPKGYNIQRVLWEMNELGILFFNGQRTNGQPTKDSYRHMTPVDMGGVDDVVKLITTASMLHDIYDRLCGINPALKGMFQNRETAGQTQLGLGQGTLATARTFYEHSQLVEDVLNGMVSLGKYLWPRQPIPRAKGATLETVGMIPLSYYGVYLENTIKNEKDREMIMAAAQQALSSGKINWGEYIQTFYADGPVDALNILSNGLTAFEKVQAEQQQQQAQIGQAMAEAQQAKVQIPLEVAKLQGEFALQIEKLKEEYKSGRTQQELTFKEDANDINNQVSVQRDLIRNAGQQELYQQSQPV